MRFQIIQNSGVEVLHLGFQHTEANAWPAEHWKINKGRWRLFTPAIQDYLNEILAPLSFGESIECFVLWLEVADFASWGGPPAFTGDQGRVRYSPKSREISSVGKLNWLDIQYLTPAQQLDHFRKAVQVAIDRIQEEKRKPKDFQVEKFADAISLLLKNAKVSEFSRAAYLRRNKM